MKSMKLAFGAFTTLAVLAACGPKPEKPPISQPTLPAATASAPPPVQRPAPQLAMGAPRLCSGQQLLTKLVAAGPLPSVDEGTRPGVMVASAKGGSKGAKGDDPFQEAYLANVERVAYIVSVKRDGARVVKSTGTGALVDAEGHVVTNYHVIENGKQDDFSFKISVFFGKLDPTTGRVVQDEVAREGRVVKVDPIRDLALIKVDDLPKGIGHIPLATKDPMPGQRVAAIGHGNVGLHWSMKGCQVASIGENKDYITNVGLGECEHYVEASTNSVDGDKLVSECKKRSDEAMNYLANQVGGQGLVIQTDCGISSGDSGGPLIDSSGRLVGVNRAVSTKVGADNGRHIHVAEVREFLQNVPSVAVQELPNPWCAGLNNTIDDVDLDGIIDVAKAESPEERALFFDLDQDTFSGAAPTTMPFDAEVAVQVDSDVLYAWYDTENDGRFDLLLAASKRGDVEKAYRILADGSLQANADLIGKALVSAENLQDKSLAPRLGTLAAALTESATDEATLRQASHDVVPDPLRGGGRKGEVADYDGDGRPDTIEVTGLHSRGWLFDIDQRSTGSLTSASELQKLLNDGAVHAPLSVVASGSNLWAFYDTDDDGEHDIALLGKDGGQGVVRALLRPKGGAWQPTSEHLGRWLFRPNLLQGGERLRGTLARVARGIAADEGLGSFPNPLELAYVFAQAPELKARVATGWSWGRSGHLLDVDGDSKPSLSPRDGMQKGSFKPDFARYHSGGVWTFYDSDGSGDWDVVLYALPEAKEPSAGYRIVGGRAVYDGALTRGAMLDPTLFSTPERVRGARELFARLYR